QQPVPRRQGAHAPADRGGGLGAGRPQAAGHPPLPPGRHRAGLRAVRQPARRGDEGGDHAVNENAPHQRGVVLSGGEGQSLTFMSSDRSRAALVARIPISWPISSWRLALAPLPAEPIITPGTGAWAAASAHTLLICTRASSLGCRAPSASITALRAWASASAVILVAWAVIAALSRSSSAVCFSI